MLNDLISMPRMSCSLRIFLSLLALLVTGPAILGQNPDIRTAETVPADGTTTAAKLVAILSQNSDPQARRAAAAALGTLDDPAAVPALSQALYDEDPATAKAAALALAASSSPVAGAILKTLSTNARHPARVWIALGLYRRGDVAGEERLKTLIGDKDASVRGQAIGVLMSLEDVNATDVFVRALETSTDPAMSIKLAKVLGKQGAREAVPALIKAARIDDRSLRDALTKALDWLASPDIYTMGVDGSNLVNLSNQPAADSNPAWSPDGRRIAFVSDRDGDLEIYVMKTDGSEVDQLTDNNNLDTEPAWSPDSSKIAFRSKRDGNCEVYVMNADGTEQTNLSRHPKCDHAPVWSPDGARIAFYSKRDKPWGLLYAMSADGSGKPELLHQCIPHSMVWSDAGILFDTYQRGDWKVVIWRPGAGDGEILTRHRGVDRNPAWLEQGKRIIFDSDRDGRTSLYTMAPDGTKVTRVGPAGLSCQDASPAPDGQTLAVTVSCFVNEADFPEVLAAAGSDSEHVRMLAVRTLVRSQDPRAASVLQKALADSSALVRGEVTIGGGNLAVQDRVPEVLLAPLQEATAQGKLLLVHFDDPRQSASRAVTKALADEGVKSCLERHYQCLTLDTGRFERHRECTGAYKIDRLPAMVVLDARGKARGVLKTPGRQGALKLRGFLLQALADAVNPPVGIHQELVPHLQAARARKKLLLMDFRNEPSTVAEPIDEWLAEEEAAVLLRDMFHRVVVNVNTQEGYQDCLRRYQLETFPHMLIFNPDGSVRTSVGVPWTREALLRALKDTTGRELTQAVAATKERPELPAEVKDQYKDVTWHEVYNENFDDPVIGDWKLHASEMGLVAQVVDGSLHLAAQDDTGWKWLEHRVDMQLTGRLTRVWFDFEMPYWGTHTGCDWLSIIVSDGQLRCSANWHPQLNRGAIFTSYGGGGKYWLRQGLSPRLDDDEPIILTDPKAIEEVGRPLEKLLYRKGNRAYKSGVSYRCQLILDGIRREMGVWWQDRQSGAVGTTGMHDLSFDTFDRVCLSVGEGYAVVENLCIDQAEATERESAKPDVQPAAQPELAQDGEPVLVPQTGHASAITSVAFSPDGRCFATGSIDKTAMLWDAATGYTIRKLTGHHAEVTAVAFSSDGRYLATGDRYGKIILRDARTGLIRNTLVRGGRRITSICFSPDNRLLAMASEEGHIDLWSVKTKRIKRTLTGHKGRVNAVCFSPDGKWLASGSADQDVILWQLADGQVADTLSGHEKPVTSVVFNPEGALIASGSSDGTIMTWDMADRTLARTLEGHDGPVNAIVFDPNGGVLASGGADKKIFFWNVGSGDILHMLEGHRSDISGIAYSPDGVSLVTVASREMLLWDAGDDVPVKEFLRLWSRVRSVAFSGDGRHVAVGGDSGGVKVWDLSTGTLDVKLSDKSGGARVLAFSPDGLSLAHAAADKTIHIRALEEGGMSGILEGHKGSPWALAFSPDERWLASAASDGNVIIWDLETGTSAHVFQAHKRTAWALAFNADSTILATGGSDQTIHLWRVSDWTELKQLQASVEHGALVFSPDGRRLASSSAKCTVTIWDCATWQPVRKLSGHQSFVGGLAFSPDGTTLASGSADNSVVIWDLATGVRKHDLRGNCGPVNAVEFGPSGQRLVAGSWDGTVTLWDTEQGKVLARFYGMEGHEWLVTTPDGYYDGSPDGKAMAAWRVKGVVHTDPELRKTYHRPDLVQEAIIPPGQTDHPEP